MNDDFMSSNDDDYYYHYYNMERIKVLAVCSFIVNCQSSSKQLQNGISIGVSNKIFVG
jgi:hypothetical protein